MKKRRPVARGSQAGRGIWSRGCAASLCTGCAQRFFPPLGHPPRRPQDVTSSGKDGAEEKVPPKNLRCREKLKAQGEKPFISHTLWGAHGFAKAPLGVLHRPPTSHLPPATNRATHKQTPPPSTFEREKKHKEKKSNGHILGKRSDFQKKFLAVLHYRPSTQKVKK